MYWVKNFEMKVGTESVVSMLCKYQLGCVYMSGGISQWRICRQLVYSQYTMTQNKILCTLFL